MELVCKQSGNYAPCKTCFNMAEELRDYAKKMGPQIVRNAEAATAK